MLNSEAVDNFIHYNNCLNKKYELINVDILTNF